MHSILNVSTAEATSKKLLTIAERARNDYKEGKTKVLRSLKDLMKHRYARYL
jgi:hypothetical protein